MEMAYSIVFLFLSEVGESTAKERSSKNKQKIRKDRAQKRAFQHLNLPFMQGKQCNDEFRYIPTGCIEKTSNCKFHVNLKFV